MRRNGLDWLNRAPRKELGICRECPKPAREGRTLCAAHLKAARLRIDDRRKQRRERLLCTECGLQPPAADGRKCPKCKRISNIRAIEHWRRGRE